MRATRAYLAGFGTSRSLLAGAALMFVLASAFVAFRGWPQVGGQSAPVLVSVPRLNAPAATRVSRALSATTAARHGAPGAGAGGLRPTTHAGPTHANRGSDQTTVPVSRDPGTSTGHPGPTPTPRTCAAGCTGRGPIPTARTTVQGATRNATHGAGSTLTKVVTTVKKVIPKSGSNGGGVVGGVTTTATNAVKGVAGGLP